MPQIGAAKTVSGAFEFEESVPMAEGDIHRKVFMRKVPLLNIAQTFEQNRTESSQTIISVSSAGIANQAAFF